MLLVTRAAGYGNAMTSFWLLFQLTLLGGLALFNPELVPHDVGQTGTIPVLSFQTAFPDQSFVVVSLCSPRKTESM